MTEVQGETLVYLAGAAVALLTAIFIVLGIKS